jgi:ParB-like chromosome segregation protein Spo0J
MSGDKSTATKSSRRAKALPKPKLKDIREASPSAADRFAGKLGPTRKIPLQQIRLNEDAFQVRDFTANTYAKRPQQIYLSAQLIEELTEAIRTHGAALDPLTVIESGPDCYEVVDGHHRYRAYSASVEPSIRIPVRVLSGSDGEARLFATLQNAKSRLNMTAQERVEAAWRLIALHPDLFEGLTQRETGVQLGVSATSVNRMMAKRGELLATADGVHLDPTLLSQWKNVDELRFTDEAREVMEKQSQARQEKIIAALSAKFSEGARKHPEDFAEALRAWFDSLNIGWMDYTLGAPCEDDEIESQF